MKRAEKAMQKQLKREARKDDDPTTADPGLYHASSAPDGDDANASD